MKNISCKGLSIIFSIIIGSFILFTIPHSVLAQDKKGSDPICTVSQNKNKIDEGKPDSLDEDLIFKLVNKHRTDIGLKPFVKDERVCTLARSRGPQLYKEIMVTGTMHAGFYDRDLNYWATENLIYMNTETQALDWWLNSPVHRHAIEGDYKYSCVACYGHSCSQIFTNFQSK